MSHGIHRTSLTRFAGSMQDPDPHGARRLAARKWHEDGSIVLLAGDVERMEWQDRELVRALATKLYGARER